MLGARGLEILLILYKYAKTHNNSELIPLLNAIQEIKGRISRKTYNKYLKAVYRLQKNKLIIIEGKFSKKSPLRITLTKEGIKTAETIITQFETLIKPIIQD